MPINVPLDEMTLPAKMELLEALWDDLSRSPDSLPSPDWHREVIEERVRLVQSGEEKFSDWADAKEEIRRRVE